MLVDEYRAHSSKRRVAGIAAAFLVAVLFVGAIGSTFSLWFLYGLLPVPQSAEMVFGVHREGAQRFSIDQLEHAAVPSAVSQSLSLFSHYVLVRHGDTYTVIGSPVLRKQLHAHATLQAAGWKVDRFAWLLRVHKSVSSLSEEAAPASLASRWMNGYRSFLAHAIRTKIEPLAFAALLPGSYPWVDRPYSFLVATEEDGVAISAAFNTREFTDILLARISHKDLPHTERDLFISSPSGVLSFISDDLAVSLEKVIGSHLGLTRTQPEVFEELKRSQRVVISNSKNSTALGIRDSADRITTFLEVVQQWFAEEKSYDSPVRQAFRLPDGTIGFELVPGESKKPFIENQTGDIPCSSALMNDELTIWLCRTGDVAAVGTSHQDALLAVTSLQDSAWRFVWQNTGQHMLPGPLTGIWQGINAVGSADQAYIRIFSDPK